MPLALFAAGSTFLLAATVWTYPSFPPADPSPELVLVFLLFTSVAIVLYSVAFVKLFVATQLLSRNEGGPGLPWVNSGRVSLLSVFLLISLLFTLPIQLGPVLALVGSITSESYVKGLLASLTFGLVFVPYLPLIFGPVILPHAFIFLHAQRMSEVGRPRLTEIGVLLLVALAVVGMVGELVFLAGATLSRELVFWIFMPLPAGLTSSAYWILLLSVTPSSRQRGGNSFHVGRPSGPER